MKIIFICGAGMISGKEVMTLALLKGLRQRGHECYCISSSWGTQLFSDRLEEIGIPYWRLRIGFITKSLQWAGIRMSIHQLIYVPSLLLKYMWLLRRVRPDLVVHTNFHHLFLLLPVLSSTNFYWSHEVTPNTSFYKNLFGLFTKKVDLFIGVSAVVGESLEKVADNEKITVIKNGIEVPQHSPTHPSATHLQLAIVGQVSEHKGHELLLKALRLVADVIPEVRLRIVGGGEVDYVNLLKHQLESSGLTNCVEWTGYLREKADMYQGVDVVVVPSVFPDPYPTSIIEAGFFGVPVIAADIGGIPEMIQEGTNGFLFKSGDETSLAETIVSVLSRYNLLNLRETSRRFALSTFALDKFVGAFEAVSLKMTEMGQRRK